MSDPSHQLDDISRHIGNFEAYVVEFRSATTGISNQIATNEKLRKDNHDLIEHRVALLERELLQRQTVIGVFGWFYRNWPQAAFLSALGLFIAWANGKVG